MNLNEIKIDKSTKMANHIPAGRSFEPIVQENKIHPIFKENPMSFEYIKTNVTESQNLSVGRAIDWGLIISVFNQ